MSTTGDTWTIAVASLHCFTSLRESIPFEISVAPDLANRIGGGLS
jgi:hypothetical protein